MRFLVVFAAAFAVAGCAFRERPLAGVLRWDAWDGQGPDAMTRVVERTLGKPKYHWRLPWFADVHADGTVSIDASRPGVMEREIDFAADAGIDYFIFLNYGMKSDKSAAFDRYLAAPNSGRIRFALCFMFIESQIPDSQWPADVEHYVRFLKDPRCVKVCGDRPLVYTFHYGDLKVNRRVLDLKAAAAKLGLNPYFVYYNNTPDAMWPMMKELGYDAMSMYATAKGAAAGPCPFSVFATNMESRVRGPALEKGIPCVPSVQTGWDKTPRQEYVPYWEKDEAYHKQRGFPDFPTLDEIADVIRRGREFVREHPEICPANTYSIYSWNEFDEGGWLCPTWTPHGPDTSRIEAVRRVLVGPPFADVRRQVAEAFAGCGDCFQRERLDKRLEQAERLASLPNRTMLMQAELDEFRRYFKEALELWSVDPSNPAVKPVVLDVADYGAKGDGKTDNAPAFRAAVAAVRALNGKPSVLRIGAGEYYFATPVTKRGDKEIINVDFGALTNCLITGMSPEKTRLVFGVYDAHGLSYSRSRNVTIARVECRWREAPFSETRVESYDPVTMSAVVRCNPQALRPDDPRYQWGSRSQVCCVFDKDGRKVYRGATPFVNSKAEDLGGGRYRVSFERKRGGMERFHPQPGDYIVIPDRRNEWNGTEPLLAEFCNFSEVWVRNARAAAINAGRTHYTTAVRCRTFPADGFVLSSNADTFYNARGSYLAHCEFHHMCDDGANSLGYGTPIRSQDGPRSLSIRAIWGRLRVGDVVQVMEAMTGRFRADLRIAKVERYVSADKLPMVRLTFDADLPPGILTAAAVGLLDDKARYAISHGLGEVPKAADLLFAPLEYGTGFTAFDNRIHDVRGCGINVQCPHSLIESNVIERITLGMKMTGLTQWFEGTPPYDVVVRNNVFRDVKSGIQSHLKTVNARNSAENPIRWVEIVSNRFERVEIPFRLDNLSDEIVKDNDFIDCKGMRK